MPAHAQDRAPNTPDIANPTFQARDQARASGSPLAPADPYPIEAAGWGQPTTHFFLSRWVEDWSKLRAQGKAPPGKAMPLIGDDVTLTLSSELRLRRHSYDNGLLTEGNDYHQLVFRAVAGADLHLGDHFRVYGEIAHGDADVAGDPSVNSPSAQYNNKLSVQQAFGEARATVAGALVGVQGGRFEFADGPRQIISFSNGPNMHRTWNGARFYLHTDRFRLGLFTGRPTALDYGTFDETTSRDERLRAVTASFALIRNRPGERLFLDPLFYRTFNAAGTSGSSTGAEHRSTYGLRLWGRKGPFTADYMVFRQTGDHLGRDIDAWLGSFSQTMLLSSRGWRPRAGLRIDLGSGGNSYGTSGTIHSFVGTYSSIGYFGEGHLLGQTNLALIAPTIAFEPIRHVSVSAEYDYARRMNQNDAVYYATRRPYAGTQDVRGYTVGTYGRMIVDWHITENLSAQLEGDHLSAGKVLERAGRPSANYGLIQLQFRY